MSEPSRPLIPQPCTVVIFGGSGDLARRKLVPALYNLLLDGLLPENCAVLATGRKPMTDEQFRESVREGITKYSRQPLKPDMWARFAPRLFYLAGAIDDPAAYAQMHDRLTQLGSEHKLSKNRIFYLAIPPTSIASAVQGLHKAGLVEPPKGPFPFSHVVVEKPIGHDLSSACEINESIARVFDESQIFRIDHYLGKETVQNVLALRFANGIFEPIWNRQFVDHVQITVAETIGIEARAAYYEQAGAIRDIFQNHLLQLLALTAMEPPIDFTSEQVRNEKVKVLR